MPGSAATRGTQVAISGGGPVGLATAIELGRRGVHCVVIEPRVTVSHARPRCKTVNIRTMEHLRRWGIAERLRERAPLSVDFSRDVVFCTSLTGWELSRFTGALSLERGDRAAEIGQQAPQYVLEELLRDVAAELETVTLRYGWSVTDVGQDEAEVRVSVRDERSGTHENLAADYAVGCDGGRSAVREAIGAKYVGEQALRPNFGMLFRAPELLARTAHGPAVQYWTVNVHAPSFMGPIDLAGTWFIGAVGVDRETGERDGAAIIDGAAGYAVGAKILSTDPWTARMQLVDRARVGRVFLAGDAAHLNPPFGGHGLNTGIGDAVDLGWKLAAVLEGWGGPRLLDSYEPERRPIQSRVIAAAAANNRVLASDLLADNLDAPGELGDRARAAADARIQAEKHAEFHALSLVLDLAYEGSPIIAAAGSVRQPADDDDPITEVRPGARLPHVWLGPDHSIYDELGEDLTLLALDGCASSELEVVARAAEARHVPLRIAHRPEPGLQERYGCCLALVRPDQHVAWCGDRVPQDVPGLIDLVRGAGSA